MDMAVYVYNLMLGFGDKKILIAHWLDILLKLMNFRIKNIVSKNKTSRKQQTSMFSHHEHGHMCTHTLIHICMHGHMNTNMEHI